MENPFVNAVEQLVALDDHEKEIIKKLIIKKSFKKNDYFLKEGEVCKYVGLIENGLVRYFINEHGEEKTYGFGKENQFVCNDESFVPQIPSRQCIQFLEDSIVWTIHYDQLQQFYKLIKNGERFGRLIIEQVFIQNLKDLNSFYTDSPQIRYEKFIKENPDIHQRISQYYIASYIGVKPQSLSRIRKRIAN